MSFFGQGPTPTGITPTAPNIGVDSFYTTVLTIAVVILIIVLAFLGWTMSKQKDTDNFPKLQTDCPKSRGKNLLHTAQSRPSKLWRRECKLHKWQHNGPGF